MDGIIFGAGCADPLYRRAVRVSMGHALLVPFARAEHWPGGLKDLRANGFRLLAMTRSPGAGTLAEVMGGLAGEKVAVLVGAEGPGLTETAMRAADFRVRIPMSRGTDSLNVATAAALAFYERLTWTQVSDDFSVRPPTPWGTGLTVAAFTAAVTGAAIVVLSMGMIRVHPVVSIGLNLVAAPWRRRCGWRRIPVRRWFVLGAAVGVTVGWLTLLALNLR